MSLLLLLFSLLLLFGGSREELTDRMRFGTADFAVYWTGYQMFARGDNPYAPQAFLQEQRNLGFPRDDLFLFFAPPWIFAPVSPFCFPDFLTSVHFWLAFNVFAIFACSLSYWSLYSTCSFRVAWIAFAAGLLSFPVFQSLQTGQVSLLITFLLTSGVVLWKRRLDFFCGIMLFGLLIKPQATFLVALLFSIRVIREQRWLVIAGGVFAFAAALLFVFLKNPPVISYWYSYMSQASGDPLSWRTATVPSLLREASVFFSNTPWAWPAWMIPSLAVIFVLTRTRYWQKEFDLEREYPVVMAASLALSPYCWANEHAILLIIPVGLAALAHRSYLSQGKLPPEARSALNWLIGVQILSILIYPVLPIPFFVAFPILMGWVWKRYSVRLNEMR